MPSKKSDQRKSDVTSARFALAEEVPETNSVAGQSPTDASPPAAAQAQPPPAQLEKKDKEKDKEKEKEKEKDKENKDAVTIEDLTLPKSIITRLAKGMLPPNTQIQANAILALSKSTTVFINYLASHANEHTLNANKKTISPADVFKALEDTEFSFLKERLEAEYEKFNAIQTEKRTSYRQKVRAAKQAPDGTSAGDDTDMADTTQADTTIASEAAASDAPRASKKARVDPTASGPADDAETEDDPDLEEDDEEDEDEDEEDDDDGANDDDDDQDKGDEASGDETQDALEEKGSREDGDEALDGDESD